MRRSLGQEVLAIGQIQEDVDQLLRQREEGIDDFFSRFYKETVLTTAALVDALEGATTEGATPDAEDPTPTDDVPDEKSRDDGRIRFRDKWKRSSGEERVSIQSGTIAGEGEVRCQSIATPIPGIEWSDGLSTPPARTMRSSFAFSKVSWGDRFRSMTPVDSPAFRPMVAPWEDAPRKTLLDDPETKRENGSEEKNADLTPTEIETREVGVQSQNLELEGPADLPVQNPEPLVQLSHHAAQEMPKCLDEACSLPEEPPSGRESKAEVDQEMEEGRQMERTGRKESMIPKPPGAPVSTIQKMKNLVTMVEHVPAHLMDLSSQEPPSKAMETETAHVGLLEKSEKDEVDAEKQGNIASHVRSFVEPSKAAESHKIAAGNHKGEIPALKKAAAAREMEARREAERKKKKDQMNQWKQLQKKQTAPVKTASKAEAPPGSKRPTDVEPSPNKKQKLETARRPKKNLPATKPRMQGALITPTGTPIPNVPGQVPSVSPQYELTPAGMLTADTRVKRVERRMNKHIPSWASDIALENSALSQRDRDPSKIFPPLLTLDPHRVFGTPDSMVVRNAAERTYRYVHRSASSCDWSDEEGED